MLLKKYCGGIFVTSFVTCILISLVITQIYWKRYITLHKECFHCVSVTLSQTLNILGCCILADPAGPGALCPTTGEVLWEGMPLRADSGEQRWRLDMLYPWPCQGIVLIKCNRGTQPWTLLWKGLYCLPLLHSINTQFTFNHRSTAMKIRRECPHIVFWSYFPNMHCQSPEHCPRDILRHIKRMADIRCIIQGACLEHVSGWLPSDGSL